MGRLKIPVAGMAMVYLLLGMVYLLLAGCSQNSQTSSQPTINSIAISAATNKIDSGTTLQLTAMGTLSSGSTQNVTTSAVWSSSNPAVLTVSTSGLVTGVSAGTATVGVLDGSVNQTLSMTVIGLQSIAVTGANALIYVGQTEQLTATGTYTDGSTSNITTVATWDSLSPSIATVSAGLVTASSTPGSAKIQAIYNGVTGTFNLTDLALGTIIITPSTLQAQLGSSTQFSARNQTGNISSQVTWASTNPATFTVVSGGALSGLVTARAVGSAMLTATLGANQTPATVTVTAGPASRLAISANPADSTLSVFTVNNASGALTPYTYSVLPSTLVEPVNVLVGPTGEYAYVAVQGGVGVLAITSASGTSMPIGALTPVAGGFYATASAPTGMSFDPAGAHLYVADGNKIFAFAVNSSSGALTPVTGSPFTNPSDSDFVAVEPLGRFLYSSDTSTGTIAAFSINANGSLQALSQPTYPAGDSPEGLAFDASGLYLYVANSGDGTIGSYTINATTGALTAVSAPTVGAEPVALTVSPTGQVYFVDAKDNTVGSASVNLASGALTANPNPQTTAASGTGILFNPAFDYLYAVEPASTSEAETFSLDANGNPLWASATATRAQGAALAFVPGNQTVYGAEFLYSLVAGQGNVLYDINVTNGTLSNQTNVDGGR